MYALLSILMQGRILFTKMKWVKKGKIGVAYALPPPIAYAILIAFVSTLHTRTTTTTTTAYVLTTTTS